MIFSSSKAARASSAFFLPVKDATWTQYWSAIGLLTVTELVEAFLLLVEVALVVVFGVSTQSSTGFTVVEDFWLTGDVDSFETVFTVIVVEFVFSGVTVSFSTVLVSSFCV